MIKQIYILAFLFCTVHLRSQNNLFIGLDSIKEPDKLDNIFVQSLFHDSTQVSSFLIFIKREVKSHKHITHDEHVYVLEGEGMMRLGELSKKIKKGDFIFIPKNTFHSVKTTSKNSLKVISLQAPFFDGKDRVLQKTEND